MRQRSSTPTRIVKPSSRPFSISAPSPRPHPKGPYDDDSSCRTRMAPAVRPSRQYGRQALPALAAAARPAARHCRGFLHVRANKGRRLVHRERQRVRALPHRLRTALREAGDRRLRRDLQRAFVPDLTRPGPVHQDLGGRFAGDDVNHRALRVPGRLAHTFKWGGSTAPPDRARRRPTLARPMDKAAMTNLRALIGIAVVLIATPAAARQASPNEP